MMKWCRFQVKGGANYALVESDQITLVEGDPFNGYQEIPNRFAKD